MDRPVQKSRPNRLPCGPTTPNEVCSWRHPHIPLMLRKLQRLIPELSLKERERETQGCAGCCVHSPPSVPLTRLCSMLFRVWLVHSVCPLVPGWNQEDQLTDTPRRPQKGCQNCAVIVGHNRTARLMPLSWADRAACCPTNICSNPPLVAGTSMWICGTVRGVGTEDQEQMWQRDSLYKLKPIIREGRKKKGKKLPNQKQPE